MKKIKDRKQYRRYRIKMRIRKSITPGTTETPRLTVFRSNKGIYAQLIDEVGPGGDARTGAVDAATRKRRVARATSEIASRLFI